jgi:hypothetical protein
MSQFDFSWWNFGGTTTSTTVLVLKPGSGVLHAVNVNSSGTGTVEFYNATSSSAATMIASINVGVPTTHLYDVVFNATLCRGQTTSTADLTVSFW